MGGTHLWAPRMTGTFALHFQKIYDMFLSRVGKDEFTSIYPEIVRLLDQVPPEQTSGPGPLAVFDAITTKIARERERSDMHLFNASKRDLHHLPLKTDNIYFGNGSSNDARLLACVSARFCKDFVNANYLCHLSANFRYLYVATPKVGFTKIKKLLYEAEQGRPVDNSVLHDPAFSPLLEPIDDIDLLDTALVSPDWFRFCFVRNPFTRLISCYIQKIVSSEPQRQRLLPVLGLAADAPTPSFEEFARLVSEQEDAARDIHWASQHYLLRPDLVNYDFVGRMERMAEDLHHVCRRLFITPFEPLDVKMHRVGGVETTAGYYDDALRRLVAQTYARDFEVFDYDSETLP